MLYGFPECLNETIASQTAMSKEGCCRFFKRMTGQTLSQYLENYRVSQSLNLLSDGKLSILQIAAQVGFSNAGRFSAAFQKRMGCTPASIPSGWASFTIIHFPPGKKPHLDNF